MNAERTMRLELSRPQATPRWFVTAAFGTFSSGPGEPAWSATSVAHAKQMGTQFTACGVFAGTWHKEWTYAFVDHPGGRCAKCIDVVRG